MYITELTRLSGKRSKKLMIRLDDGSRIQIYCGEADKYGLSEGAQITDDKWEQLMKEVFIPRARSRAMHLLERQDRTRHNLIQKLQEGGYPQRAIDEAVAYVESYHYIDDMRYASSYVRYHQYGKSRRRITMDLRSKGVSQEIIEEALDREFVTSEVDMIRSIIRKRGYDPAQKDMKQKQKLYRFLLGRGFSYEDIDSAMSKNTGH